MSIQSGSIKASNDSEPQLLLKIKIPRKQEKTKKKDIFLPPKNLAEKIQWSSQIKNLLAQKTEDEEELKILRKRWRSVLVDKITQVEYRMNDIVRYKIQFRYAHEELVLTRAELLKWRPRGYLRQLKERYKEVEFIIERVIAIDRSEKRFRYLCKFLRYPESDNSWVESTEIKTGKKKILEYLFNGTLIGKQLLGQVTTRKSASGPNKKIFMKDG